MKYPVHSQVLPGLHELEFVVPVPGGMVWATEQCRQCPAVAQRCDLEVGEAVVTGFRQMWSDQEGHNGALPQPEMVEVGRWVCICERVKECADKQSEVWMHAKRLGQCCHAHYRWRCYHHVEPGHLGCGFCWPSFDGIWR